MGAAAGGLAAQAAGIRTVFAVGSVATLGLLALSLAVVPAADLEAQRGGPVDA